MFPLELVVVHYKFRVFMQLNTVADGCWWFSSSDKRPRKEECRIGGTEQEFDFKGSAINRIFMYFL